MGRKLVDIVNSCNELIEKNEYKSFDLFDALTCNWIDNLTKRSDLTRRIAIQINALSPVNLHWLGMQKRVHTKLISDLIWSFSINNNSVKSRLLFDTLLKLRCDIPSLAWGLNFPYTSRFINADENTPNLYNTTTSGIAICELALIDEGNEEYKTILKSISDSLFEVFQFIDESKKGWFSYYPGQKAPTYNVNALAAYYLCKSNNVLNQPYTSKEIVRKLLNLLIQEQNADGSWMYSRSKKGMWVDGFHSGFIIESLAYVYTHGYESTELKRTLERAWEFYINNLFTEDGFPKYFKDSSKYPVEAQNCAQAIQTLSVVGLWMGWHQIELLDKTINNSIKYLYDENGFFYYKMNKWFRYKQSYFRWSTSPMLVAISYAEKYYLSLNINKSTNAI